MSKRIVLTYLPNILDLPTDEIPYGLMVMDNILKRHFSDVKLLSINRKIIEEKESLNLYDVSENIEWILDVIVEQNPDIVDFYTMCSNFYVCIEVAERLKKLNSNIKIIMSGPHATLVAENIMKVYECVDIVAMGEGEKNGIKVINYLLGSEEVPKGAAYRYKGEVIIDWESGNRIEMSESPFIDQGLYRSLCKEDSITIEGGRGCPFGCYFCSTQLFWGNVFKLKKIDMIINEIQFYYKKYEVRQFFICHDLFTLKKDFIKNFCLKLLELRLDIKWTCSSRADTIDEEMIDLMAKAGCCTIYFGIETGSQRMQNIINKNLDLQKSEAVIETVLSKNISCVCSFIYGFPEETIEDLNQTLDMIYRIKKIESRFISDKKKAIIQLHKFTFLPGTGVTKKYFDKLEYSYLNTMSYLDDKLEIPDFIEKRIKDNKEAFVNCYEIKTNKSSEFDRFIGEFVIIIFNNLYYYNQDLISQLIDEFKDLYELISSYYKCDSELFNEIVRFSFRNSGDEGIKILNEAFHELTEELIQSDARCRKFKIIDN